MSAVKPPALVVGTSFGCRVHVPALRAAGFDVVGLVGSDVARTQKRAGASGVPQAFTNLDIAIKQTGAVAVTIATPPHTHAPLSIAAMSRGCHVICEKPFAKDAAEARTMLDAAKRAGVVHLIGHEFRWLPEWATVARAIAGGLIGQPRFATVLQYVPLIASPDAKMPRWWFDEEAGGGWLGAHGAHVIDQLRMWLGEFASLSAALPIVSAREGVAEDSYVLRFRLANGVEGVVQQTAGAWGPQAGMSRVAGTTGTLWLEGSTVKVADRDGVRDLPVPADLVLPPAEPTSGPAQFGLAPFTKLCEVFRARIEGDALPSAVPVPTFADGVAGMEVLDAIRRSAANQGALVTLAH
jgi:predicted dehydrogenase